MWAEAIANGKLKLCTTSVAQAKGIYPNLLAWIDGHPRIGAIVAFQSETDFALGKAGLDHVTASKAEGRLDEAWVLVLRRKQGMEPYQYVNSATVEAVAKVVSDIPARTGQWGEFWWLPTTI